MTRYDISPLTRKSLEKANDRLLGVIEDLAEEIQKVIEEKAPLDCIDSLQTLQLQLSGIHSVLVLLEDLCFDN